MFSYHPTLPNASHHVSSQVTSRRRLRFHVNSESKKITSMCTNASEVTHLSVDSTLVELLEPQKHKDDLPVPWKSGHKSCDERGSIFSRQQSANTATFVRGIWHVALGNSQQPH